MFYSHLSLFAVEFIGGRWSPQGLLSFRHTSYSAPGPTNFSKAGKLFWKFRRRENFWDCAQIVLSDYHLRKCATYSLPAVLNSNVLITHNEVTMQQKWCAEGNLLFFKYFCKMFIYLRVFRVRQRAFRSVVDRLLCMLKVKGSNPLMSMFCPPLMFCRVAYTAREQTVVSPLTFLNIINMNISRHAHACVSKGYLKLER